MAQDPTFADYESTPTFTDDFNAGGSPGPNGDWIIDQDLITLLGGPLAAPQFVGSLPSGLDAAYAGDPVANNPSGDSAVMLIGNLDADNGSTFGLNYVDLADPVAGSGNNSYEGLVDYRFDASLYFLGTADTSERFQGGIGLHAGNGQPDLFRAGAFHNTSDTGGGPGFGARGVATGTNLYPNPNPLTNGRWVQMSVMVLGDRVATVVDANGDEILDESDPDEYQVWDRDTVTPDLASGYPLVWAVGEVSSDVKPLFVDDVALYLPQGPPPPPRYLDLPTRNADLVVSQAEIETFTTGSASLRGMGMLPTGELVFWDNDGATAANSAGILSIDPLDADPPSTLAILVPAADIDPALNAAGTLVAMNSIVADSAGTIYCSDFEGGGEDIIKIVDPGGGSQVVSNILTADGHVGIVLNAAEDQVVIAQEAFYGATSDDIVTLPVAGGSTTALLTQADITTLTDATDNDFSLPGLDPDTGDILVFNNVSRFGAGPVGDEDALLRITEPGGVANTVVEAEMADLPANDNFDVVVADSYGNIYLFEDDFESNADSKIVILLTQGGTATIDYSELEAVTGGSQFEAEQVQVYEDNDEVTLFISDDDTSSIVALTIGTTQATSVQSWEIYR